jgi:hypothetical protein
MLCDKNGQCFSDRKIAKKFKILSLSHQTVSRRVTETADNVSDILRCVMTDNMKILSNLVHGRTVLKERAFITFLEEMDADYVDIPLHSDIRWLSVEMFALIFCAKKRNSSVSSN